jgi:hypothetical protein
MPILHIHPQVSRLQIRQDDEGSGKILSVLQGIRKAQPTKIRQREGNVKRKGCQSQ